MGMTDQAAWRLAVRAALAQAEGASSEIWLTTIVGRRVRTSRSHAKGSSPWLRQDAMRV